MDQRCEQMRADLWSAGDPAAAGSPEQLALARTHLDSCAGCQAYLKRETHLLRRLSEVKVSSAWGTCSTDLRTSLLDRLDAEAIAGAPVVPISTRRTARALRWPAWTGAAAALALIAGGLTLSGTAEAPVADAAFVADYVQAALPEMPGDDHSFAQVAAFFEEQFGDSMLPAALLDAPVRRVAVCDVEGRRGAMVEYDFGGQRLVYYQLPLEGSRGTEGLKTAKDGGYNVARWGDDESEHVLVSALPVAQLKQLARQRMN